MRSKGQVKTSFAVSPRSAISLSQTIQITHAVPVQPTVAGKRYALLAEMPCCIFCHLHSERPHCCSAPSQGSQEVSEQDRKHMQHALTLAKQGLGKTYPNPAVGCVIVKQGKVAWDPPTTSTSTSMANHDMFKSHHSACFGSDQKEMNIIAGHNSVLTPRMALYTASRLNKQLGMCLYQCSN